MDEHEATLVQSFEVGGIVTEVHRNRAGEFAVFQYPANGDSPWDNVADVLKAEVLKGIVEGLALAHAWMQRQVGGGQLQ